MNKSINNNGYDYVDLELPSGTLWATCNIGATKPTDFGLYFQCVDTIGYTTDEVGLLRRTLDKLNPSDDGKTFTKYTNTGDAANRYMNGDWHVPTSEQIQELIDNTIGTWMALNGVNGMTFTSKKDDTKSIFIPAAGYTLTSGLVYGKGMKGNLWSSALSDSHVSNGYSLYFYSGALGLGNDNRSYKFPIRGVIDKKSYNSKEEKNDMKEKLNLVEILKDASLDTKLYSPICGECELFQVNATSNTYPIVCVGFNDRIDYYFNSDGTYTENEGAECVLFPSKDNRDWSTFKVSNEHKHFEPYQKVLIKDKFCSKYFWVAALYSHYDTLTNKHYLVGSDWAEDEDIIPYEGNEDKVGKII